MFNKHVHFDDKNKKKLIQNGDENFGNLDIDLRCA